MYILLLYIFIRLRPTLFPTSLVDAATLDVSMLPALLESVLCVRLSVCLSVCLCVCVRVCARATKERVKVSSSEEMEDASMAPCSRGKLVQYR
jgi:hypothetical protein